MTASEIIRAQFQTSFGRIGILLMSVLWVLTLHLSDGLLPAQAILLAPIMHFSIIVITGKFIYFLYYMLDNYNFVKLYSESFLYRLKLAYLVTREIGDIKMIQSIYDKATMMNESITKEELNKLIEQYQIDYKI